VTGVMAGVDNVTGVMMAGVDDVIGVMMAGVDDVIGVMMAGVDDVTGMMAADRCDDVTGVMAARGMLANPAMFTGAESTTLECLQDWVSSLDHLCSYVEDCRC